MKITNHGPQCGFTGFMSAVELADFATRWPCYDGPRRAGWAAFTSGGDLIDLSAGWRECDGAALSAIIDDMKQAIAKAGAA